MNKYRVLKPYPKQITNSGRLITLRKGASVYLKKEAQVLRLVKMGYLKPVVALPKKSKPAPKKDLSSKSEAQPVEEVKEQKSQRRKSKSEYLNKKKKGKSDSQE